MQGPEGKRSASARRRFGRSSGKEGCSRLRSQRRRDPLSFSVPEKLLESVPTRFLHAPMYADSSNFDHRSPSNHRFQSFSLSFIVIVFPRVIFGCVKRPTLRFRYYFEALSEICMIIPAPLFARMDECSFDNLSLPLGEYHFIEKRTSFWNASVCECVVGN